ncbi:helix-turn-helix domain-containing protein [Sphingomonas sp. ac-8]|uniref:helix-turn-helix domain-containing protein n=1 Tax=Sphingomonas sp. ac-8 TaxID=3242977 RepID=UPI003A804C00
MITADVGVRLREARRASGLNQTDFAARAGVSRNSQTEYETGKTAPNTDYLGRLAALGFDVAYILTGQRAESALSSDEAKVLDRFRNLDSEGQRLILGVLTRMLPTT